MTDSNETQERPDIDDLYVRLRRIARDFMARERTGHTLQPTALVHEAYLKLETPDSPQWSDSTHFVACASRAMRQILVDHARRYLAAKRGGGAERVPLTVTSIPQERDLSPEDLLDVDRALDRLAEQEPNGRRHVAIIEHVWFGGMSLGEAAETLSLSRRQATRDWAWARTWLERELR